MGYVLIPKKKILGLTANEAYTYFCLLTKSDYNTYVSHVRLDTLSELTGINKEYISTHIKTLISKELILYKDKQHHTGNKGYFDTCTYHLYKPATKWVRISTDLLHADIPNKLKGFLILLKCICLSNTNYTGYGKSAISKLLHISRPTINAYLALCTRLQLLREEENGYTLTDTRLFIVDLAKTGKDAFYISVRNYLCQQGLIPPAYDRPSVWKMIYHFSGSSDYMVDALKRKRIPKGTNCTWTYLAKVLNVDIAEKPQKEYPPVLL